ncbi:hypothetical protein Tco_1268617 [Tanacetum coccineum]
MAATGPSNLLARLIAETRRFLNLMRDEAQTARSCISQLTALIAELEAMGDQDEVFDTFMCLRDDIRDENTKLMGLNDAIAEVEEKTAMKEEHVKIIEADILEMGQFELLLLLAGLCSYGCEELEIGQMFSYHSFIYTISFKSLAMAAFLLLDKLAEVDGSSRLQDRMNLVFSGVRSEDESFIGLMRDLCFGFRIRLNKNQWLIAELEALGQRGDALRSLDYLREMVARDSGMLRVLDNYWRVLMLGCI